MRNHYLLPRYIAALLALAMLCPCAGHASASAGLDRRQRMDVLQGRLLDAVKTLEGRLQRDPAPVELRDVANGALVAIASGNAAEAERLLRLAYDQQEMRPGSTFGELPWHIGTRDVHDANAIDFGTESLGPILSAYSGQLSPAFLDYMRPHAQASLAALVRQPVPISYTNIYVMNLTNTLLIAEWLQDEATTRLAYAKLDAWMDYTGKFGVHEFDSPTYNAVVLNGLYMGHQHSASPDVRKKFGHALDYLWTDLAANYFQGGEKLAGSHSRDYDFLFGEGSMDAYYFMEAFQDTFAPKVSLERAYLLENSRSGGYISGVKRYGIDTSRIITQRWDEDLQKYRYTFITPDFAIGVANGQYGPQDKMFAMDFATSVRDGKLQQVPSIYLATTTTGIPYGRDRTLDRSGHPKPKHLTNGLAAVQKNGLALLLADADPQSDRKANRFYVDMVLPSAAAITLNGVRVGVDSRLKRDIVSGDTIGLQIGNACFAIRPLAVSGAAHTQTLVADDDGIALGAIRLSTSFTSVTQHDQMQSAYLAFARRCEGEHNVAEDTLRTAQIKSSGVQHLWTVEAHLGDTVLGVSYNLDTHASVSTTVDGAVFKTPPLHVTEVRLTKESR